MSLRDLATGHAVRKRRSITLLLADHPPSYGAFLPSTFNYSILIIVPLLFSSHLVVFLPVYHSNKKNNHAIFHFCKYKNSPKTMMEKLQQQQQRRQQQYTTTMPDRRKRLRFHARCTNSTDLYVKLDDQGVSHR